ncbi:unnamed protein product [Lupinus luteus]|uniref:Pulmonary surfactant-associated protein B n=1 Tax=Lupinus luteus TaxID=3873 RepID=A0AAV1WAA4_LUPLU
MGGRLTGFLFLIVLGAALSCDARQMRIANTDTSISDLPNAVLNEKSDVCALCEEYTVEALDYLDNENNQKEIIRTLHNTCYQMLSFKKQCIELVDYYASLFFSQIASVQPGELCKKFSLCPNSTNTSQVQENSCGFCRDTVSALVVKLNDPDTELQIMQAVLKMCNSMENLTKNCKRMVSEYGPLIFVNAEKFLKTDEICTALHACPATTEVSQES